MRFLTRSLTAALLSVLAFGIISQPATAAIPSTAPYNTDPVNTWVQDSTSQGLNTLNMVLCIIGAMDPSAMVNKGNYIALIDQNKCNANSETSSSNSTSGSSGASSAPNYITATVNVSRASNSDPMVVKAWMSVQEQGTTVTVYAHGSATKSPTDAPPYGAMRVDYLGKTSSATYFNGYVDTNGADVKFYESDPQDSSTTALAMTVATSGTASGTMAITKSSTTTTYNFAYDGSETNYPSGVFRRDQGSSDECFDRAKANANKSVWRYGTYNAADGTRVDQTNPGFPVKLSYNGNSYFGYAGYWGISFQGWDPNSLGSDGLVSGATVTDQRPNNTNTYSLTKVSGKLVKWTQHNSTLKAMDGIPFTYHGDLTGKTSGNSAVTGWATWQLQWNDSASDFTVIGKQNCGSNCTIANISPVATVTPGTFKSQMINGWSQSFGGYINIPSTGSAHASSDTVSYYSQITVIPGSTGAPSQLYCLSFCPTQASLSAFTGSNSPYNSSTTTQAGSGSTEVTYSFDPSYGLEQNSTPMTVTSSSKLTGQYSNGIMTGRLFDTAFGSSCGSTYCEPNNPTTYYTWQTGTDQWSQTLWLTNNSTSKVVSFDPPENISYTVPSGSPYGNWAGKTIQLQFNGFGNLYGIPGGCFDPTNNSSESCNTSGAIYMPEFAIPDGTTMTLNNGSTSTSLIVKALDAGLRLKNVSCSTVSLSQPTSSATLPDSTGLHDPSNSTDADYIGIKPTVTAAPKVIQGVLQ